MTTLDFVSFKSKQFGHFLFLRAEILPLIIHM